MSRWTFLVFTAACTNASAPASSTAPAPSLPSLRFFSDDGELGATLSPDGRVRAAHHAADGPGPSHVVWEDQGTISADGEITSRDGKLHTRLNPDGTFEGVPPTVRIDGDSILLPKNPSKITIDDHGNITGGFRPMRVEGAVGPAGKRAALLVLVGPIVFEGLSMHKRGPAYGMPGVEPLTGLAGCDGFLHRVKTCEGLSSGAKQSVMSRVETWKAQAASAPDQVSEVCRDEAVRLESDLHGAGC